MAETVQGLMRDYLTLLEAGEPWGVSYSDLFGESLRENTRIFPDLPERVEKFIDAKINDPLSIRYGKHDRPMTGALVGFWHTHLKDDAVLVYNLVNRCINLVYIAKHSEIEGKRLRKTADRLAAYNTTRQAGSSKKASRR